MATNKYQFVRRYYLVSFFVCFAPLKNEFYFFGILFHFSFQCQSTSVVLYFLFYSRLVLLFGLSLVVEKPDVSRVMMMITTLTYRSLFFITSKLQTISNFFLVLLFDVPKMLPIFLPVGAGFSLLWCVWNIEWWWFERRCVQSSTLSVLTIFIWKKERERRDFFPSRCLTI